MLYANPYYLILPSKMFLIIDFIMLLPIADTSNSPPHVLQEYSVASKKE